MTRLFHGSTVLAGLCAMTLVVGCGGSGGKKSDASTDAKRDTSGDVRADVRTPDGPAVTPDGPAVTADGPAVASDGPAVTPDVPAVIPDAPAVTPDGPAVTTDGAAVTPDGATVTPDNRPADVTSATDVRPPDGAVPTDTARDTTASDLARDVTPDAGVDTPAVDVAADSPVDSPADAPADAAADGGAGDAGDAGCVGVLCHDFQGDNPDAGLPSEFTAVGAASTWGVFVDSGNVLLQGTHGGGTPDYVRTNVGTWTDQTIEVKVRFVTAPTGNQVRICGRASNDLVTAYCVYISTVAGAGGATGGSMEIWKRRTNVNGNPVRLGLVTTGLGIMVGTWHTYKLTIGDAGPVTVEAFLDGTSAVTQVDNTTPYYSAGEVALGVSTVSADFDNLVVTTP